MRDYFEQVLRAVERREMLQRRLLRYYELGTSTTPKYGGIASKPSGSSKVEASAVGMVDVADEIREELAQLSAMIAEAEDLISRIPKERFRTLLTLKYLKGWRWCEITREMGYTSKNSVFKARNFAFAAAEAAKRPGD